MKAAVTDVGSEALSVSETLSVRDRVRKVVKDHGRLSISLETLDDSADLGDAGMTSHANVMVMLALENEFGIEFPDNMLSRSVFESIETITVAIKSLKELE
jgi:acyl carrier protein